MKRVAVIVGSLLLCALITIVPAFAIQSGFYTNGQAKIQLLGGQYQIELMGIGDDAVIFFDTRDMYMFDEGSHGGLGFDNVSYSLSAPDVSVTNIIETDIDASIVYNDLVLTIDYPDFPTADTIATTYFSSDRFTLAPDARLGIHLSPIMNNDTSEYLVPAGDIVNATITFHALTVDGAIIDVPMYRDDLIVGGTYDLTTRIQEFFVGRDIQYFWVEYEGEQVVPTFVQDFHFVSIPNVPYDVPLTSVLVVDYMTDIVYPEVVSYDNFNLLEWISTAVDGFMRAPLFILGDFTVTLGAVLAVSIAVPIFVAFLRRYAGG